MMQSLSVFDSILIDTEAFGTYGNRDRSSELTATKRHFYDGFAKASRYGDSFFEFQSLDFSFHFEDKNLLEMIIVRPL